MSVDVPPLLVISKFLPEYTGAAVRINNLYRSLFPGNISVICGSTEYLTVKRYELDNFQITRLPSQVGSNFSTLVLSSQIIFGLVALFHAIGPVVRANSVHIVGNNSTTASILLLAKILRKKIIYEAVTEYSGAYQRFLGLFKVKLPASAKIIAISRQIEKNIQSQKFKGQIWCRPNPVNFDVFKKQTHDRKQKFFLKHEIKTEKKILMFIGKFIPTKKQDFLLKVLNELPDDYHLILAGPISKTGAHIERDSNYVKSLENYIKYCQLQKRVTVITEFVNSDEYIPNADIYMAFSISEGLGTTVLEAIASEVCVLANDAVPSYKEFIETAKGSYLVSMNEKEVASKILEIKTIKNHNIALKDDRDALAQIASQAVIESKYTELLT